MDQWLDSLSEDWVSQPRSPHSDPLRRSSSALSVTSNASNISQSRIPRFKPRASSNLRPNGPTSSKRASSGSSHPNRQRVLKERSSSNLNVARNRNPDNPASQQSPEKGERLRSKQHASSASVPSVPQDTIQYRTSKISLNKDHEPGSTPEWKRRVLQGKVGIAGPDLFGPIGLENIFKPPTVGRGSKPAEKPKRGKQYRPVAVDEFPSSPPPFPSDLSSANRSGASDRRHSSFLKQMDTLEEISEGDSRHANRNDVDQRPEALKKPQRSESVQAPEGAVAEEDQNEVLSQVLLPTRRNKDVLPTSEVFQERADESGHPGDDVEPSVSGRASPKSHGNLDRSAASIASSGIADEPLPAGDWTSHSLPDDLSTGTDLYAANGGFVNIRRGGYSNEGSFNNRLLSPSSLPDFDAPELRSPSPTRRLSTRSRGNNAREQLADQPRSALITPRKKQHIKSNSADEPQSSGSPLKLFDKYDTFTNERLIRRISKYEDSLHESEEGPFQDEARRNGSCRIGRPSSRSQDLPRQDKETGASQSNRRISSFGEGQLDNFPFHADHPFKSKSRLVANENDAQPALSRQGELFRSQEITVTSRGMNEVNIQVDATQTTNGKRLPYSPKKESQAKRRRTLRSSEERRLEIHQYAEPVEAPIALQANADHGYNASSQAPDSSHLISKPVVGKKRKDARYDDESQVVDPKILALRRILRPRTPTPNPRGSQKSLANEADLAPQDVRNPHHTDITAVEDLDHQTQALAGELASFTLNMAQDMTQGSRKASVTTADFFNEAKQIMQLIRNQARPQSSHDILEEAEEDESELLKPPVDDSTIDEFSRPPSREGGSLRRPRELAQVDARVVSHLRKFEDTDDFGLALPSSVKTMHIMDSLDPSMSPDKSADGGVQHESSRIQSDPPNIRIRAQAERYGEGGENHSKRKVSITSTEARSCTSHTSSGPSTGRSVPTGSSQGSRGSGTKAVIAPQVVSHLLSDNVGGMTFDHNKQVWVKRKGSRGSQGFEAHSRTGSDVTENLFEDIPDLSVDELQEQQRTQRNVTSIKVLGTASDRVTNHDQIEGHQVDNQSSRPPTRDSALTGTVCQGSAPSKFSHFASSGPIPETRATSWGDEALASKSIRVQVQPSNSNALPHNEGHSEEVEHEISILEGRTSEVPLRFHHGQRQPRVVTVAFSSPLIDNVEDSKADHDTAEPWGDGDDLDLADSPVRDNTRSSSAGQRCTPSGRGKRSVYRSGSRRASVGLARPMSRVDENEELTFLQSFHNARNTSMNLVLTTPLPAARSMLQPPAFSSAQTSHIGFQLSPLSDFTVHKDGERVNRDADLVIRHRGFLSTHEVEGKLSLAVQELVKNLTDIEPYEPYWDYIRYVDLQNRSLRTLHMLDEFCSHIEVLDVSDNELSQLHGAPLGIRHLKAGGNCLSNLTSWGHLQNLQYLDVTSNQLSSLVGFQSLVHLRELNATDNRIESLEGILELDGLIKLKLRGNCIKTRLTDLDLERNGLAEINNLDHLPALKRLNLSENALETLDFVEGSGSLQDLRLANNHLRALDIGRLPVLQFLDIDKNAIACISNIAAHTRLEVLSWREQRLGSDSPGASVQYQQCLNVRELYLSRNTLRSFAPSVHLLDLRRLEIASAGLQTLSEDFGVKCSNLRVLNLNFNALTELRPLLGLVKLEKLHLASNRVSRLRRTASVLNRIGHELVEIDLRQNPLTLDYYIPQQQPRQTSDQQLTVQSKRLSAGGADAGAFKPMKDCSEYILPWMEQDADDAARQRLDEDTKIRRRVYEMLVSLQCMNVRRLDGLCLDRRKVAAKDGLWERLMELGVLTSKGERDAVELEG
ncbi:MAG: hypothetical protein Q9166_003275 [cf. Caloplaca sp. 2 TL-2023]